MRRMRKIAAALGLWLQVVAWVAMPAWLQVDDPPCIHLTEVLAELRLCNPETVGEPEPPGPPASPWTRLGIIGLVLLSGVLLHRHGTRPCGP